MQLSDGEIMDGVRQGRLEGLSELFERHHRSLFQFFLHLTGSRDTSEDLVQEVFVRLLKYRHTFQPEGQFVAWMYQVARNAHMDHWRKRKGEVAMPDDTLHQSASPEPRTDDRIQRRQEVELLRQALNRLPVEKREVLVLSRFQNMKYEEIAAVMGCEVGTVKTRVFRALRELGSNYQALAAGRAS